MEYPPYYEQQPPVEVSLKNEELWNSFHNEETEMIITKAGRRMFPSYDFVLGKLDPKAHYCIALEFNLVSRCRYKYSTTGGWVPAGAEEAQSVHRFYLHPDSPATGEYWMRQPISFHKVKLTNNPSPPVGQIVLSSMHKYQPTIIITKTADPRAMRWAPVITHTFKQTQFIAVTAYQNESITQLKIDNNPFAKGFRENGHSKTKKRRSQPLETVEESPKGKKIKREEENSSPEVIDEGRVSQSSAESSPGRQSPVEPTVYPPVYPGLMMYQPYYSPYYYYPQYLYPHHMAVDLRQNTKYEEEQQKRITDFSIRAILETA